MIDIECNNKMMQNRLSYATLIIIILMSPMLSRVSNWSNNWHVCNDIEVAMNLRCDLITDRFLHFDS